jgi:hypothetical protein
VLTSDKTADAREIIVHGSAMKTRFTVVSLAPAVVAAVRKDMSHMLFVEGMILMCVSPLLWLVLSPVYIAILVGMVCALLAVLLLQRAP